MTPKEKAAQLIAKFLDTVNYIDDDGKSIIHAEPYTSAKRCALVAVIEIIKNKPKEPTDYSDTIQYWKEVEKILNQ